MREMAIKNYENTKKEFPLSTAVPHADLGLMRVYYRNGDFSNVTNQFIELSKPNVPDSLRFHGAYLMGQTHLQTNDLQKAIQVLSIVPEEHPDYIFAQHAIAIARARLDSDMSEIVMALENCVGAKAETPAQKEVVNRSYLFLGYIFYEENTLSKAVVALRMVPTSSYYAEDALLGQGWTALKARQWTDCISTGQLLSKTSQKGILQCEGMLIQAYGHLLQKQYAQSLALLKTASEKIRTLSTPSEDSLNYSRCSMKATVCLTYSWLIKSITFQWWDRLPLWALR
jgi:outer membrane protein assembly factor BamD (BamD/ComL family)